MNIKYILAIITICCIFLLSRQIVTAQTTNQQTTFALKQMLPTSPEAALLGRFGDIPVGPYTGTAEISIPLYTIKLVGLEIPINLSYHSSGIKVEDMASNVGLGWLLEPGGAIIQITNGMEDISDDFVSSKPSDYAFLKSHVAIAGFHGARTQIGYDACLCHSVTGTGDSYQSMQGLLLGQLQPDIFQYSFPGGHSGKFYINPETQLPVLIDKSEQINFTKISGGWVATTLDGNKFSFTAQENSNDGTTLHDGYTWKLSKIQMFNGKTVDFSYTQGSYSWTTYSETYHNDYPIGVRDNGYDAPLETSAELTVQPHPGAINNIVQTINQIKTKDVLIKFNLVPRQDVSTPAIQSMDILDAVTGIKLKTVNFNYTYFNYSQTGGTYLSPSSQWPFLSQSTLDQQGKRLKLLSVQETGYLNGMAKINPAYQFTYNENNNLPLRTSFSRDYWGYYNGFNNTTLTPDLTYFYITNQTPGQLPYYMLNAYKTSNRAIDTSKMASGMLTKIVYPTGGATAFGYEPNSFTNYDYPDIKKLQNTNLIANIFVQDYNDPLTPSSATFSLPGKLTLPFSIFFGKGIPQNSVTFNDMLDAYVVLKKISGGVTTELKRWVLTTDKRTEFDNNGGITINDTYSFNADPSAQYQIIASIPDGLGNQHEAMKNASASCSITNVPQMPQTSNAPKLSYGAGLRIAKIRNYDANGAVINTKSYKYINADQTSSGVLMSPLQLVYDRPMHFEYFSHINPLNGDPENPNNLSMQRADADIWWVTSESATPFSYSAAGNLVGYSRVEEIEQSSTASTDNGKIVHYYNNNPSEVGYNTPDNPDLLNGKPSHEEIYSNSGSKLEETGYNYASLADNTFTAFKAMYNVVLNYACEPFTIKTPLYPANSYLILEYPINSKWYKLINKTNTKYFNGTANTIIEGMTYNSLGQVSRDSITNSLGQVITTHNKWPIDIAATQRTPTQQSLIDSGFYENMIEQHLLNNQIETGQAKVTYALKNNQLVRSQIDRSVNKGSFFTDAIFDSYGTNKNIQQVRQKGISPSALIWDANNTYILAQVSNASLADIAYSSFETNQPGNWTIASASRDNTTAITGGNSFNLANGALNKSSLTAGTTYIVSYWTRNSAPLAIAGTINGYPIKGATVNGWTNYEHRVTGQTTITISGSGNIDEVRLYPVNAQMSTYTYAPLIGITSTTDPKGKVTYYEYDNFQRLRDMKNKDGNVVKHMDYHYQGQ